MARRKRYVALSNAAPRFGDLIRAARLKRGWDLDDLYVQSGVSRTAISRIERNERLPTTKTCNQLADALGLNRHRLFLARLNAGMPEGFVVSDESGYTFRCQSAGKVKSSL